MKKIILSSILLTGLLTSCSVTKPFLATNNEVGSKIGKSSSVCLLTGGQATYAGMFNGIMLNKNFGIVEAAKKGGIEKIGLVDLKITNYIIFVKKEFIVSGE